MIYLDNAATTFPKPESVIRKTEECIVKYCSNSGRSSHSLAIKTSEEIFYTRDALSDFLSIGKPENICFTLNATYALNIAIKCLISEKCHVLISDVEHNSVLRPLYTLKNEIEIEYSSFSTDGNIRESIKAAIRSDTRAIVSTLCSNVTGAEIPLNVLSEIARDYNLILIVDASQLIGHKKIDLKKNPCDALCAPAHKGLFGIQGAGFVVFPKKAPSKTIIEGGSGNDSMNPTMPKDLPEKFEAGTLPSPSIVSLGAGIDFINEIGIEQISKRIDNLTSVFHEELKKIKGITVLAAQNGIISFSVNKLRSSVVSDMLNYRGIYTRSGLHCAPMAHIKLGSVNMGLTRVSLSVFNTEDDALHLSRALNDVL